MFLVLWVAIIAGIVFLGAVFGHGGQSSAGSLPQDGAIAANGTVADRSPGTAPCAPLDANAKVACTRETLVARLGKPDKYAQRASDSPNVCPVNNNGHPQDTFLKDAKVTFEYVFLTKGIHCSGDMLYTTTSWAPTQWNLDRCDRFPPTTWDEYKAKYLGGSDLDFQDWVDNGNLDF